MVTMMTLTIQCGLIKIKARICVRQSDRKPGCEKRTIRSYVTIELYCETPKHKMFLTLVAINILVLVSLPTPSSSQGDNSTCTSTLRFPVRVISSNQQAGFCPPSEELRSEIARDVRNLLRNTMLTPAICCAAQSQASPAASCSALPTSCSSGYYWIRSRNGTAVQVFCDMDRVCGCNNTGGWTRVANLNMSDPSQQCPGEWMLQTLSSEPSRLCRRGNYGAGCVSANYRTFGIRYNHVCGRLVGYQTSYTDAFGTGTIEDPYVDGVSITHGLPGARQHIWSFASGLAEFRHNTYPNFSCPCVSGRVAPSFVGNDYFCESGNPGPGLRTGVLTNDPLWDGQGCGTPPCCELSFPPGAPWFCKQLSQATTDDIEVRICRDELSTEDTPLELVELYIH